MLQYSLFETDPREPRSPRNDVRTGDAAEATRTTVYGGEPVPPDELTGEFAFENLLRPSRGLEPSFGIREFEVEDGENRLYILKLKGDVAAFLGRQNFEVAGKCVVKVGHAKSRRSAAIRTTLIYRRPAGFRGRSRLRLHHSVVAVRRRKRKMV